MLEATEGDYDSVNAVTLKRTHTALNLLKGDRPGSVYEYLAECVVASPYIYLAP